jgi:hypothetical protein
MFQNSDNPKLFITGIPTAGKSYLARKLINATGGYCLETDNLYEELGHDPRYAKWAKFFEENNEYAYYTQNDPEKQWSILAEMHEKLWPGVLERIRSYEAGDIPFKSRIAGFLRRPFSPKRLLIFEGINILPHLAKKDLDFPGVVLVGKSLEEVLERNRQRPRWGKTEEMIKMGAEAFWSIERPHYIEEARNCGYEVFEDADEAYEKIMKTIDLP